MSNPNRRWYADLPWICPSHHHTCRNRPSNSDQAQSLLPSAEGKLLGGESEYPVLNDVPILLPKTDTGISSNTDRERFYSDHYKRRSRVQDLDTDYLIWERTWIANYIRDQGIEGLVLEVGCGTGIFADCSPNYLGMDYSLTSVFAEGFERYRRFVGDAQCIPLASATVELVFSFNTLEHVPDPDLALQEIVRVLKPGGHAILHPAWNCVAYNTRLVPVRQFRDLPFKDKIIKALLPVLRHRAFKIVARVPGRIARSILASGRRNRTLRYRTLTPYLGPEMFIADCDATASIDICDAILYFRSRGWHCPSHPNIIRAVLSPHVPLVVIKPLEIHKSFDPDHLT